MEFARWLAVFVGLIGWFICILCALQDGSMRVMMLGLGLVIGASIVAVILDAYC